MELKLAAYRRYRNKTQQYMADLIGVDIRTYINKEQGVSQFKANEMFAIASDFNLTIEELFLPENFMKLEVSKEAIR